MNIKQVYHKLSHSPNTQSTEKRTELEELFGS